jgi:hypothetical protein
VSCLFEQTGYLRTSEFLPYGTCPTATHRLVLHCFVTRVPANPPGRTRQYPGFTLQMYTHMLPSSYDRARHAVDRRLERLASRLTEQRRSTGNQGPEDRSLDDGPGLL